MSNTLKLKADHISLLSIGFNSIIVLINPIDLQVIDTKIKYTKVEITDHNTNYHEIVGSFKITNISEENYNENDKIQKVVHVYLTKIY